MKGKVFIAQEVQSILNGSKVMFREVIKPQPIQPEGFSDAYFDCYNKSNQWNWWTKDNKQLLGQIVKCPYQVGQKIFCKEKFSIIKNVNFNYPPHDWRRDGQYIYEADAARSVGMYGCVKWKPAQHMKQEHSRLTLQIKSIGVERLQELTFGDALREGISDTFEGSYDGEMLLEKFKDDWNATHKKPEEKFEASPFIWKIHFEVINN